MRFDEAIHQAIALQKAGKPTEAQAIYRRLLDIKPDDPLTLYLSGLAAHESGDLTLAMQQISRARDLHPAAADVHYGMGNLLLDLGRTDEALTSYRAVLERRPNFLPALKKIARLTASETAAADVLAQDPNDTDALITLGNALQSRHAVTDAIACFSKAIQIDSALPGAHHNLANALSLAGRNDEAIAQYKRSLNLHPNPTVHSHLLMTMHYCPQFSPEEIFAEHLNWANLYAKPLHPSIHTHDRIDRSPNRRLRLGYVSGDFRAHAVLFFLEPLLQNHDRTNFEVICYSNTTNPDQWTTRYKSLADQWRDIAPLSDEQAAALVQSDRIDLLIDLGGHTGSPRLLLFARKPVPVQITYLGYPDTTGLSTIDYRLTDSISDPPGTTGSLHAEQLVRLPGSFLSYQPPPNLPEPSIPKNPSITFGSFNNLAKITPQVIDTWARILTAIPGSRLVLKNYSLQDPTIRQRLADDFSARGINQDRLDLLAPILIHSQHVETFNRIDIALDPFPYNGTTSTFEALWMGVPVITLADRSHISRVGASLLTNARLPDLIATTPDQYIATALRLAADRARLREIRSTLRQQMSQSILTDTKLHTRHIEDAYRQMWQKFAARDS